MERKLRVDDLMTTEPVAVQPSTDLETARDLMHEWHIRHLPVVDAQGRVVGLVSDRDLARISRFASSEGPASTAALQATPVGDVMTLGVTTVERQTDIRTAAGIMLEHKYGCLPVVDGRRLIGILTEADFVRLMAPGS